VRLTSRFSICLLVLLFATNLAGVAQTSPPTNATLVVDALPLAKAGSKIDLKITLTNVSSKGIIGNFEDLSHSELNYDFDVRDAQGNSVAMTPYMKAIQGSDQEQDGHYLIRTHQGLGGYLVKPGEKIVGNADLAKLYVLKPGTYTVQLSWWENYSRYRDPQKSRHGIGIVVVKSNTIVIKVSD